MSHKTISIGGITYDLFVDTGEELVQSVNNQMAFTLPLGDKIPVKKVIETCGGGASNTSIGLSRLHCKASFCGVIASDQWGQTLQDNLQKENVDLSCVTVVDREFSSFSIVLSAGSGERTILYTPGANTHLHDALFNREIVSEQDWVYLNHIQEHSNVIEDDIIDILTEDNNVRFTWNPGGCQLDMGINEVHNRRLLSQTDMLLLNRKEALIFTKTNTILDALITLVNAGAKVICITDGGHGTTATDGTHLYKCPILSNIVPLDTTGAGDAFGTGVTWALLEGLDLPTALRAGTINAASVVSYIGAQKGLLTHTDMWLQLNKTVLDVEVSNLR